MYNLNNYTNTKKKRKDNLQSNNSNLCNNQLNQNRKQEIISVHHQSHY